MPENVTERKRMEDLGEDGIEILIPEVATGK
jgi:hypothetical protein